MGRSLGGPSISGGVTPRSGGSGTTVLRGSGPATNVTPRIHTNPGISSGGSVKKGGGTGSNSGSSIISGKPVGSGNTISGAAGNLRGKGVPIDSGKPNAKLDARSLGGPNSKPDARHEALGRHPDSLKGKPGLDGKHGGQGIVNGAVGGGRNNLTAAAGVGNRHVHHSANYWANQSYFFGNSSPFGRHCQFNNNFHHHYNRFPSYGWGGGWGWGIGIGIGYPYGFGWGNPYGYWSNPWTTWNGGFPCYSYNAVSPWYGYGATTFAPDGDPSVVLMPEDGSLPPEADAMPADETKEPDVDGLDYAAIGEREFFAGEYARAVKSFRHAMVEDPGNGACALLLAQGLFQTGAFEEAAGATQLATQLLPEEKWGVVGDHRRELYGSNEDYVKQLRVLEDAIRDKRDAPALRFLLGWHYGFNGYPKEAVDQLNKVVALAPKDEIAVQVRDVMQKKMRVER